jgi:hypothetical protein
MATLSGSQGFTSAARAAAAEQSSSTPQIGPVSHVRACIIIASIPQTRRCSDSRVRCFDRLIVRDCLSSNTTMDKQPMCQWSRDMKEAQAVPAFG